MVGTSCAFHDTVTRGLHRSDQTHCVPCADARVLRSLGCSLRVLGAISARFTAGKCGAGAARCFLPSAPRTCVGHSMKQSGCRSCASVRLLLRPSVCPSVCLSVCVFAVRQRSRAVHLCYANNSSRCGAPRDGL